MDYASQQRNPTRNTVGIGVVVLMHIGLAWALLNGLGRAVIDVIKAPIETKIIEEVKPPPPPPPENLPPPPKLAAPPPPSFVPPPEIKIATPPKAPTITVTQEAPPPAPPVTIAPAPAPEPSPPAPPAPPAPPPPPKFTARAASFNANAAGCKPEFPAAALRAQATGTTRVKLTIDAQGNVTNAEVIQRSGRSREHRALDRAAETAFSQCKGRPGIDANGNPVGGTAMVDYVWKID